MVIEAQADNFEVRRASVFISYSRADKEFVRRLDQALAERDRKAWVDLEDIRPTEEWLSGVYSGIEGASAFVFVISPESVRSESCLQELTHAVEHNKRIVPIVRREAKVSAVPEPLRAPQWIFFRDGDNFAEAFKDLVDALDTDLDWVVDLAFSPNGKLLATASYDKTARVWDLTNSGLITLDIARMTHEGRIEDINFSEDGKYLVTASEDNTARVWLPTTGEEVARRTHENGLWMAVFSKDGKYLATLSPSEGVHVWSSWWKPERLLNETCARMNRNLLSIEWEEHLPYEPYRETCPNLEDSQDAYEVDEGAN